MHQHGTTQTNWRHWWGLLRRRPHEDDIDIASLGLLPATMSLALGFVLLWVIALLCAAGASISVDWYSAIAAPIVVVLIAVLIPFLPRGITNRWNIRGLSWLIREKGFLSYWDVIVGGVAAAGFGIAAAQLPADFKAKFVAGGDEIQIALSATMFLTVGISLWVAIQLWITPAPPFEQRQWTIVTPPWLVEHDGTTDQASAGEGTALHEVDSVPLTLKLLGAPGDSEMTFTVGVRIDTIGSLDPLREINRASGGRLYQTNPLAVVVSQGPPVNGVGTSEIDRLCKQILKAAERHRLSHYMLASSILCFVQRAIVYERDEASTAGVFGPPGFADYGRFPVESLFDLKGDCECSAILCASILARCGLPCALIFVSVQGNKHAAVGLEATGAMMRNIPGGAGDMALVVDPRTKRRYLYGETATDGDDEALGFGLVPVEWRKTLVVDRVDVIST